MADPFIAIGYDPNDGYFYKDQDKKAVMFDTFDELKDHISETYHVENYPDYFISMHTWELRTHNEGKEILDLVALLREEQFNEIEDRERREAQ